MRNEKLLNTLFTFMHLQHEADVIMCLCVWSQSKCKWRRCFCCCFTFNWGSWTVNECDSVTLTYHECCTMSTTGLFLMHTVIMLYCTFFFMLCLCLTVWASNWLWRGGDLCVCVALYTGSNQRLVRQRKPVYVLWSCWAKSPWWSRL